MWKSDFKKGPIGVPIEKPMIATDPQVTVVPTSLQQTNTFKVIIF